MEADIIVTATGLNVQALGGMTLTVDGAPVHAPHRFVYKGMMLSGVPNFVFVFGYTNASWTLKVGRCASTSAGCCAYMDARGYDTARPVAADPGMPSRPFSDFGSGYIKRALDQLPRQGSRAPWRISPTHRADARLLRRAGRRTGTGLLVRRLPAARQPAHRRRRGRVMDEELRAELLRRMEKDQAARLARDCDWERSRRWTRRTCPGSRA